MDVLYPADYYMILISRAENVGLNGKAFDLYSKDKRFESGQGKPIMLRFFVVFLGPSRKIQE
jgi:hypothetical protein